MNIRRFLLRTSISLAVLASPALHAQFAGTAGPDNFRDTSVLRPPPGAKVALIVFEDLACPACAKAHPLEMAAIAQTHVALLRYDFPLVAHIWTHQGAVDARYIEHTFGPQLAEQYRSDVFAAQRTITSKDDLQQFTMSWMQKHGKTMPMVIDASGALAKEVDADVALGKRLNVEYTPTIAIVTRNQYQVVSGTKDGATKPELILPALKVAMARAR